MVKKVCKFV